MARDEPHALNAVDELDPPQEGIEADPRSEALAVGVHGLTEESHFPHAVVGETTDLIEDHLGRTGDFFPARRRNDAVGADHVAPAHHRDVRVPRLRSEVAATGEDERRIHLGRDRRLGAGAGIVDEFRELVELARADHEVEVRHPLQELRLFVLRDATEECEHQVGLFLFATPEGLETRDRPLLRLLPNRASVVENHTRFIGIVRELIAMLRKALEHQLGVELVHLATEDLEVDTTLPGSGGRTIIELHRIRRLHESLQEKRAAIEAGFRGASLSRRATERIESSKIVGRGVGGVNARGEIRRIQPLASPPDRGLNGRLGNNSLVFRDGGRMGNEPIESIGRSQTGGESLPRARVRSSRIVRRSRRRDDGSENAGFLRSFDRGVSLRA